MIRLLVLFVCFFLCAPVLADKVKTNRWGQPRAFSTKKVIKISGVIMIPGGMITIGEVEIDPVQMRKNAVGRAKMRKAKGRRRLFRR